MLSVNMFDPCLYSIDTHSTTTDFHSPTSCMAGMVTATPSQSMTMTYSSPPATVSTPPPGFSNAPPVLPSPGGYNSGQPWAYTKMDGQRVSLQFPFTTIVVKTHEKIFQQHTQAGGIQHVQQATSQNVSQGGPLQPNAMIYNQGGGGQYLHGATGGQTSNPQLPVNSISGSLPNYQAASGSYHMSTTHHLQGQSVAHSNPSNVWSGHSSTNSTQAITAGAGQGSGFNQGTTVTDQPRSHNQQKHQTGTKISQITQTCMINR